jgi:pyruvate/2-oxoacid:ferredoxin oxidoreductase alpha subunit
MNMPVPVTYATFRKYVFNWDTWQPREILEDIRDILDDLKVNSVKLRFIRPKTLREHKLLEHFTAHNFVVVTSVPQLYKRRLIIETFKDFMVEFRVDGVVLIRKSALEQVMSVLIAR